ncbi:hypothetical protein GC167_06280 [bacterium]|nr:hypothetical protein [bacterium]
MPTPHKLGLRMRREAFRYGFRLALVPAVVGLFHAFLLQPLWLPESWRLSVVFAFYPALWLAFWGLHLGLSALAERDRARLGGGWVVGSTTLGFLAIGFLLPDLIGKTPRALPLSIQFFLPFTAVFVSDAVLTVRWIADLGKD